METSAYAMMAVIFATFLGSAGALLVKIGSKHVGYDMKKNLSNKYLIAGIGAYGASALIFVPSLKYGELSVLYPLVSVGYIWTLILSAVILKEKINVYKISGLCLIIIGISFIGFGS